MKQHCPSKHTFLAVTLPLVLCGRFAWSDTVSVAGPSSDASAFKPYVHLQIVGGTTTGDPHTLAGHDHDPHTESISVQGLELGGSLALGEGLTAFAAGALHWDEEMGAEAELEEAFLTYRNEATGLSVRGGQFFNRLGLTNHKHHHSWNFVDNHLPLSRFLGAGGLTTIGAEVTWNLPLDSISTSSSVVLSFGRSPKHDHADEAHKTGAADHGPAEMEAGEEHLDAGDLALAKDFLTGSWTTQWRPSDQHSIVAGLSGAYGKNSTGDQTLLAGFHAAYEWRENGLQEGGRSFRWENELLWRKADSISDDVGVTSAIIYGIDDWQLALRADWVQENADAELPERFRISPAVTYHLPMPKGKANIRLQYNYDDLSGSGEEHSLWLQFGIGFGSGLSH